MPNIVALVKRCKAVIYNITPYLFNCRTAYNLENENPGIIYLFFPFVCYLLLIGS